MLQIFFSRFFGLDFVTFWLLTWVVFSCLGASPAPPLTYKKGEDVKSKQVHIITWSSLSHSSKRLWIWLSKHFFSLSGHVWLLQEKHFFARFWIWRKTDFSSLELGNHQEHQPYVTYKLLLGCFDMAFVNSLWMPYCVHCWKPLQKSICFHGRMKTLDIWSTFQRDNCNFQKSYIVSIFQQSICIRVSFNVFVSNLIMFWKWLEYIWCLECRRTLKNSNWMVSHLSDEKQCASKSN